MLTNYKTQCESKVKKWIEDTTGKEGFKHLSKDKFENLSLEDYQEFVVDCKVEVGHTLNAEYTEEVVAGSTDKEGEFVSSKEEYEKAIKRYLNEDLNNPTHFQSLVSKIEQGTYAQHSEKSTIANGQTILYKHTCHTCNGNSEQKCTECKGQGEVRCSECAGRGEYRCSRCEGRGEVKCKECKGYGKERCRRCEGGGKPLIYDYKRGGIYRSSDLCSNCNGTGIIGACRSCQGKGTVWCNYCKGGMKECYRCNRTGYMKCPSCDGKAIITCKTCKGTNQITEITQIKLTMTPKYSTNYPENIDEQAKQIIDKYITSNNTDIANITRTELKQDESQKRVVEIYQFQTPFAKFNVSFEGKKFAWFVYGKNLQVENGQEEMQQAFKDYEFQMLEKDADALVEIAEKSSFLDLSIIKKSQPVVANLMNSEINQSIIQTDIDNSSLSYEDMTNSIQSKFDTPLSKDYIEKVVEAFHTIANCFSRSVTIATLGLAFAVSFMVAVAFFMPFFVNIFSTMVILAIFIRLGIKYKAKTILECWGQKLHIWTTMFDYTSIKLTYSHIIIGVIVVFLSYYVNETKLKQMSVSTSTTKQTKQPRQNTASQEQKPTLVMPKCDEKGLLDYISNLQIKGINDTFKDNPNKWIEIKEQAKAKGIEYSSVQQYVSSLKLDYSNIKTTLTDASHYKVECSAKVVANYPLPHTEYLFEYGAQGTEKDISVNKLKFKKISKDESAPKASNESQSVTQNAPSNESKNANSAQSAQSKNIQASFDCAKANTRVERLICADEELANLDIELSKAYANARNSLDNEGKKTLLSEQKKWLENYNQCDDKPCVLHNLRKRIRALKVYNE